MLQGWWDWEEFKLNYLKDNQTAKIGVTNNNRQQVPRPLLLTLRHPELLLRIVLILLREGSSHLHLGCTTRRAVSLEAQELIQLINSSHSLLLIPLHHKLRMNKEENAQLLVWLWPLQSWILKMGELLLRLLLSPKLATSLVMVYLIQTNKQIRTHRTTTVDLSFLQNLQE